METYNVKYAKSYYQRNKERILKYQKNYYDENNKHRKKRIDPKTIQYKIKNEEHVIKFE